MSQTSLRVVEVYELNEFIEPMEEPAHSAMGSRTATAPASPRSPSGMLSYVLLIVFTVFIVYPLSIGPAVVLHRNSGSAVQQTIETFYTPLEYICDQNETASAIVLRWIELWR